MSTRVSTVWLRVLTAFLAAAPSVLAHSGTRRFASIGAHPTTRVRSRLQPSPSPRPPATRPGGHTVVYLDVTSTLESPWRAGIQRVVVELLDRLPRVDPRLDLVAIRWSAPDQAYRRLTPAEWRDLFSGAPTGRRVHGAASGVTVPPAVRRVGRVGRRAVRIAGEALGVRRMRRAVQRRLRPAGVTDLLLPGFTPGSWFLDADASWNVVDAPRSELLDTLHHDGVRVAWLAYDLFPLEFPDWFDPGLVRVFNAHARAHADAADLILSISRHTGDGVAEVVRTRGRTDGPELAVVPLAADPVAPAAATDVSNVVSDGTPFLLMVGTVEPRKNHAVVVDAWERLRHDHPHLHLVIAGRPGWRAEEIAERIRSHPSFGRHLVWADDLDDGSIDTLYRRCAAVVVASWTEGFGLPVVEALGRGATVVSSNRGALPEAGGDAAMYFDPADAGDLEQVLRKVLAGGAPAAPAPRARTWDEYASEVAMRLTSPVGMG